MTGLPRSLRPPCWFALAAIAGMLSMAGEASAGSCCVQVSAPDCCCSSKATAEPVAKVAGEPRITKSNQPCDCRADEPAGSPASKPESSSPRRLEGRGEVPEAPGFARPLASISQYLPPNTGPPPNSPLHLLTTRLLI